MAMFFHTKKKTGKDSKRQSKNKLPKLSAIEAQVKDFFPFKIRPDSAKTGNSKTSNSKLDTTDSSKFDDMSRSSVLTSTITMTTKSGRFLSSGTTPQKNMMTSATTTQNIVQAPSTTEKHNVKLNPQIFVSEDTKSLSETLIPLRETTRKEGSCRRGLPVKTMDRRGSPERACTRSSPERVSRPERQILYRAPYYEKYCKRNLPRSLTYVSDYVFRWTYDSARCVKTESQSSESSIRSCKSEIGHKPKLGPLHHARPSSPTRPTKLHDLEIVPRKLYLARPLNLSCPPEVPPPGNSSSSNLPSSVVVPSVTSSPHLLLDLNKCTKFRITLQDLSCASERIYRIHSLRASRNVRESVWVPAKAVISEETER